MHDLKYEGACLEELKKGNYIEAERLAREAISAVPDSDIAHYVLLMASHGCKGAAELSEKFGWDEGELFENAMKYSDGLKAALEDAIEKNLRLKEERLERAKEAIANKEYRTAYMLLSDILSYKNARALRAVAAEGMGDYFMEGGAPSAALPFYEESGNAEKIEAAERPVRAIEEFKKETGDPNTYFDRRLAKEHPALIREYERLRSLSHKTYTHELPYFISAIVMVISSILMMFDSDVRYAPIYIAWGIACSVLIHQEMIWDFGFIKSIALSFATSLAPLVVRVLCDELLSIAVLGPAIVLVFSAIVFLLELKRRVGAKKAIHNSNKAASFKTKELLPKVREMRSELKSRYADRINEETLTQLIKSLRFS